MKRPWKNFAVVCAWCQDDGRAALLRPLAYAPAYKTFTISHGLCRFHYLKSISDAGVLTFKESVELFKMKFTRLRGGLKWLVMELWNA